MGQLDRNARQNVALLAANTVDETLARQLQNSLSIPLLATGIDPLHCTDATAVLIISGQTLCLQQTGKGAPGPVEVDFGNARSRYRNRSGGGELMAKAVGYGKKTPLRILDATAGLGRDAFVLAGLGCEVTLCEREPIVVELLRSGLQRANDSDDLWLSEITQRMHLCPGDARQSDDKELQARDVIYLDPMFPQRAKSAAVKKEMALFQSLLENAVEPEDADALLRWALQQDVARVVVKRPAKAPNLAALKPSHCIAGKSVRYDVYVKRKLA